MARSSRKPIATEPVLNLPLGNLEATRDLGARLAPLIRGGDVIALHGQLGAGKSELARSLIRARAGAPIEVPSPTFTLIQDYPIGDLLLRHIDLYRIGDAGELIEIGLDTPDQQEVWLVEWPERAADHLPEDQLVILLEQGASADARLARICAGPSWRMRLLALADG